MLIRPGGCSKQASQLQQAHVKPSWTGHMGVGLHACVQCNMIYMPLSPGPHAARRHAPAPAQCASVRQPCPTVKCLSQCSFWLRMQLMPLLVLSPQHKKLDGSSVTRLVYFPITHSCGDSTICTSCKHDYAADTHTPTLSTANRGHRYLTSTATVVDRPGTCQPNSTPRCLHGRPGASMLTAV